MDGTGRPDGLRCASYRRCLTKGSCGESPYIRDFNLECLPVLQIAALGRLSRKAAEPRLYTDIHMADIIPLHVFK